MTRAISTEAVDPPLGVFELLSTGAGDVLLGVVDKPADLVHVFLEHQVKAAFPQVRIASAATALAPGVAFRAAVSVGMVVVRSHPRARGRSHSHMRRHPNRGAPPHAMRT